MVDTIRVASRSPMAIRIIESAEGKEPGTELRTAVLNGNAATRGSLEGVTEVNADLFRQWMKDNAGHPAVVAGLIREVGKDEDLAGPEKFGFELALQAATTGENASLAEKGSTLTAPGPVSSPDMRTTSDAPADDSPRSQTKFTDAADASRPVVPTPPATPAAAPLAAPAGVPPKAADKK